jgi:hypothetical protein
VRTAFTGKNPLFSRFSCARIARSAADRKCFLIYFLIGFLRSGMKAETYAGCGVREFDQSYLAFLDSVRMNTKEAKKQTSGQAESES